MTFRSTYRRARALARRLGREERGATLVEFALVIFLFLLLIFGVIDFGRLAFHYVTAEKALYNATRIAVVRPPACNGVSALNTRSSANTATVPPDFGTRCNAGANICQAHATVSCTGDATNATVSEVWAMVRGTLPNDAQPSNLRFTYAYDPDLGFLGGPYVPLVTVEVEGLDFEFISYLGALFTVTAGDNPDWSENGIAFPSLSVSMPAEDLCIPSLDTGAGSDNCRYEEAS